MSYTNHFFTSGIRYKLVFLDVEKIVFTLGVGVKEEFLSVQKDDGIMSFLRLML